ncbi:MAG: transposase [Thermoguttaceae bacterium]|nr:transposase [Thermoguttaceae bacterium]MDW8037055.1 hypothetical protein [Thermoguttaceae bacterium]
MVSRIYFIQRCPICGRRLNIRLEYLGRRMLCQHCGGQFVAQDPGTGTHSPSETLRRAQELLDNSSELSPPGQFPHPR